MLSLVLVSLLPAFLLAFLLILTHLSPGPPALQPFTPSRFHVPISIKGTKRSSTSVPLFTAGGAIPLPPPTCRSPPFLPPLPAAPSSLLPSMPALGVHFRHTRSGLFTTQPFQSAPPTPFFLAHPLHPTPPLHSRMPPGSPPCACAGHVRSSAALLCTTSSLTVFPAILTAALTHSHPTPAFPPVLCGPRDLLFVCDSLLPPVPRVSRHNNHLPSRSFFPILDPRCHPPLLPWTRAPHAPYYDCHAPYPLAHLFPFTTLPNILYVLNPYHTAPRSRLTPLPPGTQYFCVLLHLPFRLPPAPDPLNIWLQLDPHPIPSGHTAPSTDLLCSLVAVVSPDAFCAEGLRIFLARNELYHQPAGARRPGPTISDADMVASGFQESFATEYANTIIANNGLSGSNATKILSYRPALMARLSAECARLAATRDALGLCESLHPLRVHLAAQDGSGRSEDLDTEVLALYAGGMEAAGHPLGEEMSLNTTVRDAVPIHTATVQFQSTASGLFAICGLPVPIEGRDLFIRHAPPPPAPPFPRHRARLLSSPPALFSSLALQILPPSPKHAPAPPSICMPPPPP